MPNHAFNILLIKNVHSNINDKHQPIKNSQIKICIKEEEDLIEKEIKSPLASTNTGVSSFSGNII